MLLTYIYDFYRIIIFLQIHPGSILQTVRFLIDKTCLEKTGRPGKELKGANWVIMVSKSPFQQLVMIKILETNLYKLSF